VGQRAPTIRDFLLNEWRNGALLGAKPEKAFFVRCDRSTMTQNDLDNGRLVCLIGVAVLKPAEFVIFRIGQKTADRQGWSRRRQP
jgi:phage tail sheath protein FI